MNCKHKDCTREGTHAPKFNFPAEGVPIDMHQPIQLIIGLPICKEHQPDIVVKDFMEDGKLQDIVAIAARGRAVDYNRTFISWVKTDSEEYKKFETMNSANKKGV